MIRKPAADWGRESAFVTSARGAAASTAAVARTGAAVARTGGHLARGVVCSAFAVLWGVVALTVGGNGSLPTGICVGLMAAFMAWSAKGAFAKARETSGAASLGEMLGRSSLGRTAAARATADATLAPETSERRGGWGGEGAFDADAIIARHLAARAESSTEEARISAPMLPAERSQFGRKVA